MNREEEKFRKAVEELRDSYELHLRRWAERCLQDIEIAYEKEKEKNKSLEQENSFLKMMYRGTDEFKAIEKLAGGGIKQC